jgi:multidrug resistance efflux pump
MAKVKCPPRPAVDLGALQSAFTNARRNVASATTNLERARAAFEKSKQNFTKAENELREATRTILDS